MMFQNTIKIISIQLLKKKKTIIKIEIIRKKQTKLKKNRNKLILFLKIKSNKDKILKNFLKKNDD